MGGPQVRPPLPSNGRRHEPREPGHSHLRAYRRAQPSPRPEEVGPVIRATGRVTPSPYRRSGPVVRGPGCRWATEGQQRRTLAAAERKFASGLGLRAAGFGGATGSRLRGGLGGMGGRTRNRSLNCRTVRRPSSHSRTGRGDRHGQQRPVLLVPVMTSAQSGRCGRRSPIRRSHARGRQEAVGVHHPWAMAPSSHTSFSRGSGRPLSRRSITMSVPTRCR